MLSPRHRRCCRVSILTLLLLLCFSSLGWSAEFAPLHAGWAKVDLTPSFSCPLAGYGKRRGAKMHGIHDPLYARALVLEGSGEHIALVSVDLLVITQALREEVARRLLPLHLTALLLCATHNHSGVGGYWNNFLAEQIAMGGYDERIFVFIVERIVQAVLEADAKKGAAKVGEGAIPVAGLNRNRQTREGPVDPELEVIRIDDATDRPLAAIVNFSAHATVLGPQNLLLSADYPGALTAALEEQLPVALFTAGASGNLAPHSPGGKDRYESASALGRALAQKAEELMAGLTTHESVSLHSQTREVHLATATTRTLVPFPFFLFTDPLFRLFTPSTTLLQAIRIDDTVLSAWPCDLGVEIGLELKARARSEWGYQQLLVVSQANDYIGYVLAEENYRHGGYETRMSFFGPRLGESLKEKMVGLLQEIR